MDNKPTNAPEGIDNYTRLLFKAFTDLINTSSVATITAIDSGKSLLRLTVDTTKDELVDVPFMTLLGGGDYLQFPISVGDKCLIIYNKDSIADWLSGDEKLVFSSDFDLNNGFAICGLNNQKTPITIKDYVDFKVTNKIKIYNDSEELISLLSESMQIMSDISNLLATTVVAGVPISTQGAFATLKITTDLLKTRLETFKV